MGSQPRLKRGDRMPPLLLQAADNGKAVALREESRVATVLVILHGGCEPCAEYLAAITQRSTEIREWDGRVVAAVVGSQPSMPEPVRDSVVQVTVDADEQLQQSGAATPAVLIADQWGELFMVEGAGTAHAFPEPGEIVEWLRYLAIQCPECQGEAL
jgi:hypothetical protein